ncbi:MAG TPA: carbamate kinase [Candidatus Mcinerneyibacterium sp.]|nr:carbamate kinase [Candidatus Mcinerneyibacterium sp.]
MTKEKVVIALGGNAIIREGEEGNIHQQFKNTRSSLDGIIEVIKDDYNIVITHGNGPQAGNMLIRTEEGVKKEVPDRPLGVIVADTEGGMGYMIEQSLQNRLKSENIDKDVVTILSQVVVDPDDPQMKNPTKPVGPFYSKEKAEKYQKEKGWNIVEDAGRGYRRVVPSPIPQTVIEKNVIKKLVDEDIVVIAAGGGGIPVYFDKNNNLEGVDAVIDKDFASAVLALEIGAKILVISTGVEKVSINFGKENQKDLEKMSVDDCKKYLDEGHFPPGSMGPKIKAAIKFLNNGGEKVYITLPEKIEEALKGKTGTLITKK